MVPVRGSMRGFSNSVISAPATKVRPAQATTRALTVGSAKAASRFSDKSCRIARLRALTGGLSMMSTAMSPARSILTSMAHACKVPRQALSRRPISPVCPPRDTTRNFFFFFFFFFFSLAQHIAHTIHNTLQKHLNINSIITTTTDHDTVTTHPSIHSLIYNNFLRASSRNSTPRCSALSLAHSIVQRRERFVDWSSARRIRGCGRRRCNRFSGGRQAAFDLLHQMMPRRAPCCWGGTERKRALGRNQKSFARRLPDRFAEHFSESPSE